MFAAGSVRCRPGEGVFSLQPWAPRKESAAATNVNVQTLLFSARKIVLRVAFALASLRLNLDPHLSSHGLHDRDVGDRTFVLCDPCRSYRITKIVKAPA